MNEDRFHEFLRGLWYTASGAKRAQRILGCVYQPQDEGYLPGGTCKDSSCPRCRKKRSFRIAQALSDVSERNHCVARFVTFTFAGSGSVAEFSKEVRDRRRFIVSVLRVVGVERVVLVAEFTVNAERIHLHFHSVVQGTDKQMKQVKELFDSYGVRFARIDEWDGSAGELAKYFFPTYGFAEGVVMSGVKNLRLWCKLGWKHDK